MRGYLVPLILGGLLAVLGVNLAFVAVDPRPYDVAGEEVIVLPLGSEWHYVYELPLAEDGGVAVAWKTGANYGDVAIFLFDEDEYAAFQESGFYMNPLRSSWEPSGDFVWQANRQGMYYLVFAHGSSLDEQSVSVTYRFSKVLPAVPDVPLLAGGLVAVTLGAGLAVWGVHLRRKAEAPSPAQATAGVLRFDREPPPTSRLCVQCKGTLLPPYAHCPQCGASQPGGRAQPPA